MTQSNNNAVSIFDPANKIGNVYKVGLSLVQVSLSTSDITVKVGSFIVINADGTAAYGKVVDMRSVQIESETDNGTKLLHIANVEIMTSIKIDNGKLKVTPGVSDYPAQEAPAYLAHPKLIKHVAEYRSGADDSNDPVQLKIAKLFKSADTAVNFTPERLYGRHLAVLGTSGGGKSWTLSKLLEESAKFNSKIILFDATGEFYPLRGGVRHVYLGHDPNPRGGSIAVSLPYYQLKEIDMFSIFSPSGQNQPSKLRAAMKTLKLLQLSPQLGYGGTFVKAHKEKAHYQQEYKRYYAEVEDPYARFDIRYLTQQIENECVFPNRGTTESNFWGGPNGQEHGDCVGLINRIDDILKGKDLAPVFYPEDKPSLFDEIEDFLTDPNSKILRVSLQYLSFAYGAREIIANAIGRYLLEMARDSVFRKNPLVVFLDEAHQFLNRTVHSDEGNNPLDSFALIAKEGRKYALTTCIATQRPRDIPDGVLSQIGTMIVHRLVNDKDRSVVERASGDVQASSLELLPSLAPGEAVVFGVDYPVPLTIQILPPTEKPDSSGPQYQKFWNS